MFLSWKYGGDSSLFQSASEKFAFTLRVLRLEILTRHLDILFKHTSFLCDRLSFQSPPLSHYNLVTNFVQD